MSGASNFLAKQKKAELVDLADSLGVEYAGLCYFRLKAHH